MALLYQGVLVLCTYPLVRGLKMKKYIITLFVGTVAILLFGLMSGCSSTVTLGPAANKDAVIGASADTSGASLTLPLIRGEVGTVEQEKK